jgi:hypothetical protein
MSGEPFWSALMFKGQNQLKIIYFNFCGDPLGVKGKNAHPSPRKDYTQ